MVLELQAKVDHLSKKVKKYKTALRSLKRSREVRDLCTPEKVATAAVENKCTGVDLFSAALERRRSATVLEMTKPMQVEPESTFALYRTDPQPLDELRWSGPFSEMSEVSTEKEEDEYRDTESGYCLVNKLGETEPVALESIEEEEEEREIQMFEPEESNEEVEEIVFDKEEVDSDEEVEVEVEGEEFEVKQEEEANMEPEEVEVEEEEVEEVEEVEVEEEEVEVEEEEVEVEEEEVEVEEEEVEVEEEEVEVEEEEVEVEEEEVEVEEEEVEVEVEEEEEVEQEEVIVAVEPKKQVEVPPPPPVPEPEEANASDDGENEVDGEIDLGGKMYYIIGTYLYETQPDGGIGEKKGSYFDENPVLFVRKPTLKRKIQQ
jgi:hypothetical protein